MKKLSFILTVVLLCSAVLVSSGCKKDDPILMEMEEEEEEEEEEEMQTEYALGWTGDDNLDEIPTSTNFGFGNGDLPASVDLLAKFPPIGDQGSFGTCVAWSVAYNIKTALNGMQNGTSGSQLASPANQASPKDLFTAIPDDEKGADCNGTNFSFALDVLQNRGVASMQTVPYTNLGGCSQSSLQSSWTSEANSNKIKYWRKIDASHQSIKQNLANNVPIILGAKLADNFMSWNSNTVLSSSTSFNNVGQHAYHALVIAGYDDSKGPNGAYKVINSWGEFWGDNGYVWIDYDYMLNEFCNGGNGSQPLFIVDNDEGSVNPPDNTDPVISTGVDLAPWVFEDYSTYDYSGISNEREMNFNVYNIGNQEASSNTGWSQYYIYYNAYDANDYGVLFYDEFNTSIDQNTFYCDTDYHCTVNLNIPAGANFTETAWGYESILRTYYMPEITGYYYLVMIADADDTFAEADELNNLFYTTIEPHYFDNGYGLRPEPGSGNSQNEFDFKNNLTMNQQELDSNIFNSAVNANRPNAYTPEEIKEFIKREKQNGRLASKVDVFAQQGNSEPYKQK